MRRLLFAVAAGLAIIVAAAALPTRAGAMTMTAPAGLAAAITETSATEQVYWRHRHWHRWGCCWGWHRHYWGRWHRPWGPWRPWGWHRRHYWGWGWHWRRHHHRWWW
jgi:hypothetical protein